MSNWKRGLERLSASFTNADLSSWTVWCFLMSGAEEGGDLAQFTWNTEFILQHKGCVYIQYLCTHGSISYLKAFNYLCFGPLLLRALDSESLCTTPLKHCQASLCCFGCVPQRLRPGSEKSLAFPFSLLINRPIRMSWAECFRGSGSGQRPPVDLVDHVQVSREELCSLPASSRSMSWEKILLKSFSLVPSVVWDLL